MSDDNMVDSHPASPLLLLPRVGLMRTNCGALLRDPATGSYRLLSQSDALALILCNGVNTWQDIVPALADLYGAPRDAVAAETRRLYSDCLNRNVLAILPVALPQPARDYREFVFVPENNPDAIHPARLSTLGLGLTEGCALSCAYCFAASARGKQPHMPTSLALRLLEEAQGVGAQYLVLGGGEPLLHPDITQIVQRAVRLGYHDIQISTKATTVSRELVAGLRRSGLDQIQISLDSWDPEEVDLLVGSRGAWSRAVQGMLYFLQEGFTISVRPTVTRINADSLPELVQVLARLGIRSVRPVTVYTIGRANEDLAPDTEQLARLEERLAEVCRQTGLRVQLAAPRVDDLRICLGARLSVYVLANGRVLPCDVIATLCGENEVLGNVHDQGLGEIWTGNRIREFRQPRVADPVCRDCEQLLMCAGGCRMCSYALTGDMNRPDPRCRKAYPDHRPGEIITYAKE